MLGFSLPERVKRVDVHGGKVLFFCAQFTFSLPFNPTISICYTEGEVEWMSLEGSY